MTSPPSAFRDRKKFVTIRTRKMAYIDVQGLAAKPTIVFLHGNPTSSYLWRNIWPYLEDLGRVIAPDLIGMGDSDKLRRPKSGDYSFLQHRDFLDDFLDEVVPDGPVVLVLHDWGSGLGFDWANRHRDRVIGIAYMEAIVQPVTWEQWPEAARDIFKALRSPAGEALCLFKNLFVENILPASIKRTLTEEEMDEYRRPFLESGLDRLPTLTWPREIPFIGEVPEVERLVSSYGQWLAGAHGLPKLFINAEPGMILTGEPREFCRSWPNQTEVTVEGLHFIQEDSAAQISGALKDWLMSKVLPGA